MRRILAVGIGLSLVIAIGLNLNKAHAGPKKQAVLTIGRVSDKPLKHYKDLKPVVDYMVSHMGDLGIEHGEVMLFKNNQELIKALKEGKVDWVSESPFSAIIYEEKGGAEIIARRVRKEASDYYSLFFVRKDSRIKSLGDLKGKKVAFEDPGSTTGYFVPKAMLIKEGLEPVELASPREKPPAGKVGYAFAGGELNITTWVYKGLAEAGAFNNSDWENSNSTPEVFKKDLKIIYRTKLFPRGVELVRGNLDPKIKERMKNVLFKAHKDPEAKEILDDYSKTEKFTPVDTELRKGLEETRRILEYIRSDFH